MTSPIANVQRQLRDLTTTIREQTAGMAALTVRVIELERVAQNLSTMATGAA
jgi:hypothetical protein